MFSRIAILAMGTQAGTLNLKAPMRTGDSHRLRVILVKTNILATEPTRAPNPQVPIQTGTIPNIKALLLGVTILDLGQLTWKPNHQIHTQEEGTIL